MPPRRYAVDTLASMARRGSITAAMQQAGEAFHDLFRVAQLDPLAARDLSKPKIAGGLLRSHRATPSESIEQARAAVWKSLLAVGGMASPAGSCLWHVVGWEQSLKEWALEQGWNGRRVSQETASGILIAALGVLEACPGQRTGGQSAVAPDLSHFAG
jgi:hypothetical protein